MSRSYRKHPFRGVTTCESEKQEKQAWHRAYRRICAVLIRQGVEDMPNFRQHSYQWMGKDGKFGFDPKKHPEWMRK